jgi:hypothetical protein
LASGLPLLEAMRNLGLALLLAATIAAPHAAFAKKHVAKRGRSAKAQRHKHSSHARGAAITPSASDALAKEVVKQREEPVLAAAAPLNVNTNANVSAKTSEPVAPNQPMSMSNQTLDEEVPGSKRKK